MFHAKVCLIVLALLIGLLAGAVLDSSMREFSLKRGRMLELIAPLLPSADTGINNSARYIRHLGLSTPASAFADYPGQPDYLPAGMMWPPPAEFPGIRSELMERLAPLRPKGVRK